MAVRATTENVNIVDYSARFHHVLGRWDFILEGLIAKHNDFKDFFGVGNGTIIDDSLDNIGFYESRYNTYGIRGGVAHEFWNKSSVSLLLNYENNKTVIAPGTILDNPNLENSPGLGALNLTEIITELDLDFRDRADLPQRGIRLYLKNQIGINSNSSDNTYGLSFAMLEKYFSTRSKKPTTLALGLGVRGLLMRK
jgi:outer membrane protein assembly factor BamA